MHWKLWTVTALALGRRFVFADGDDGDADYDDDDDDYEEENEIYGPTRANNATTPTAQYEGVTVHYVTVGKAQNEFVPNSIVANVGDIVSFSFYPLNHSVIRAAYGYPCIPIEDIDYQAPSFYSGFMPIPEIVDNPPVWNITVNSTQPIFYYCGASGSCNGWGMVGVINANASQSIAKQIELARASDYMLLPGQPFPDEDEITSLRSLAGSVTPTTIYVSHTPTHPPTHSATVSDNDSGLSTGATAGIAVGAAVAALVIAGLFVLMCRTRSLKKKLAEQQAANQLLDRQSTGMQSPATYGGPGGFQDKTSGHNSQLPPYKQYNEFYRESHDPNKQAYDSWQSMAPTARSTSPHQSPYGMNQHYMGAPSPDPSQQGRFSNTSELHGTQQPVIELDAPQREMTERDRF